MDAPLLFNLCVITVTQSILFSRLVHSPSHHARFLNPASGCGAISTLVGKNSILHHHCHGNKKWEMVYWRKKNEACQESGALSREWSFIGKYVWCHCRPGMLRSWPSEQQSLEASLKGGTDEALCELLWLLSLKRQSVESNLTPRDQECVYPKHEISTVWVRHDVLFSCSQTSHSNTISMTNPNWNISQYSKTL